MPQRRLETMALLRECSARGILLAERKGRLLARDPEGRMDEALKQRVARQGRALVRLLAGRERYAIERTAGSDNTREFPPQDDSFPLTPYQTGFYAMSLEERDNRSVLNQAGVFDLDEAPSPAEWREAMERLARRHPALRISLFSGEDGEIRQRARETCSLPLEDFEVTEQDADAAVEGLIDRFKSAAYDLERDFLFRAAIVRKPGGRATVVLGGHHIVLDGWSMGLILDDLAAILQKAELPPQGCGYEEYARNAALLPRLPRMEGHRRYWRDKLKHANPLLSLRENRHREASPGPDAERAVIHRPLAPDLIPNLERWAVASECSLFAALYTALRLALFAATGERDDTVITIAANREHHPDIAGLAGCLINVLPLFAPLDERLTAKDLLKDSQETVLEALEHQELPFGALLEASGIRPCQGRTPLGQVMLLLQNAFSMDGRPGVRCRIPRLPIAHYELSFVVWDRGREGFLLHTEHAPSLYSADRVNSLIDLFISICEVLPRCGETAGRDIPAIAAPKGKPPSDQEKGEGDLPAGDLGVNLLRALSGPDVPASRTDGATVADALSSVLAERGLAADRALCLWTGPEGPARAALMAACLNLDLPIALAGNDPAVLPERLAAVYSVFGNRVILAGHASLPEEIADPHATEAHNLRTEGVGDVSLLFQSSRPDASGMGRNGENDRAGDRLREALASVDGKPALLCPDGVTPASWQALSRTALCAAVHDLRIVMDTLPGRGLNFLPGEEADSTGLLTLAGAAAGRRLRWGRPEDDGWDRVDKATPVTTDWSKAASLLWGGAETVLLVNSLPSAAFFSNNPDLCDSCRLLLRMPGLAGFCEAILTGPWHGDELFCPATNCMSDLSRGFNAGSAGTGLFSACERLELPLPHPEARILWRDGLSVDADALTGVFNSSGRPPSLVFGALSPPDGRKDGLLSDQGEMVLWLGGGIGDVEALQECSRLPEVLKPSLIVPLEQIPCRGGYRVDRRALAAIPALCEPLLERANAASRERGEAEMALVKQDRPEDSASFSTIKTMPLGPDDGLGGTLPWFIHNAAGFLEEPLQGVMPVPDEGEAFAPDRFLILIDDAERGEALAAALLRMTPGNILLVRAKGPEDQDGGSRLPRLVGADPSLLHEKGISGLVAFGRERFGGQPGGLLHLMTEEVSSLPRGSLYHEFHKLRPFAQVMGLCLRSRGREELPGMQGRYAALRKLFGRRNAEAPFSHICLSLPAEPCCEDATGDEVVARILIQALSSGAEAVYAGPSRDKAAAASLLQERKYRARDSLQVPFSRNDARITFPLALGSGFPASLGFIENENRYPELGTTRAADVHEEMARIWNSVLPAGGSAMEQGFFDAGGNSLIIPRLRQAISGAFGVDIGMTGVFKYSSLRSLTAFVLHELRSEDETRAKNKAANSAGSVRYGVGLAASPGGTDRHDLQRAARRERKQQRIRQ